LLSLALMASLTIIGCDSGGDSQTLGDAGTTSTGGGTGGSGGGTASSGTGSAGLTGATLTGIGSGNGGSSGTSSTTGGTSGTGSTGTSTTGTSTGTGGSGGFGDALQPDPIGQITSLNNPTQMVRLGNTVYFVDGFGLGNNGRLLASSITVTGDTVTFGDPVQVTAKAGSAESATLINPFGLATDGTDLFISVGFNSPPDAAILKVSGLTATGGAISGTFSNLIEGADFPVNPAFMLVATVNGGEFCYWSEYSDQASGGRIRRVHTDGTGTVDTVINQLNFPAGIATDGSNLVICDSGGGQSSLGQVVRVPLSFTGTTPRTPQSADANVIGVATGDQAISRPFDVDFVSGAGFYFTEGNAIEGTGPGPLGQSAGTVRFLPTSSTTSQVVVDSVTNGAGIDAVSLGNGSVGLAYVESISAPNGRVMRAVVSSTTPAVVTPSQIDTGLSFPLDIAVVSPTVPVFAALINYNGGQASGLLNVYGP
jgi:hypothetical protein